MNSSKQRAEVLSADPALAQAQQTEHFSKRMIPALGTFVRLELNLSGDDFIQYSNLMFAEIRRVESLFSLFDPGSEIAQLNRAKANEWLMLSSEVISLLKLSQTLSTESQGSFRAGPLLSFESNRLCKRGEGDFDLGGIAKGYAVDCGVETLFAERKKAMRPKIYGSLNAGGDLFMFSQHPVEIELKHETSQASHREPYSLAHGAVATSSLLSKNSAAASYRNQHAFLQSVSVHAAKATLADAFTKIALFSESRNIFSKWGVQIIHEV